MSDNPDSRQGLPLRPVAGIFTYAHVEPEIHMWAAALALLIEDANDYIISGPDKYGQRLEAYRDMHTCGPMLRRLAERAAVDPEFIQSVWRHGLPKTGGAFKVERGRASDRSLNLIRTTA